MFGSGMAFGINAIDLSSPSDFLLAGFRDPALGAIAVIAGLGLYGLWGKGLTNRRYRLALAPTAMVFLMMVSAGSSVYRYAVVAGRWRDSSFGPLEMKVSLKKEGEGNGVTGVENVKLVLATAEFLVFHGDPDRTIVLRRDAVVRIEAKQRKNQSFF